MNKRGISSVIIEILFVLITITAVALVISFVVPFVKNNLQKSTECVDFRDSLKFQESVSFKNIDYKFNCQRDGFYGFTIKNNGGMKNGSGVSSFAVTFSDGKNIKRVIIKEGMDKNSEISMLNGSIAKLKVPETGGVQTYVYKNSAINFTTMELYPVLGNDRVCDKTDSIGIVTCAENINLNLT